MKRLSLLVIALLPALAVADATPIRLTAEQERAAGIDLVPLASLASHGARQFPAQAVVPPQRMEVIAAPLAALVGAVGAARGETVKRGQMLARLQGPQLLELQREYRVAGAQAEVALENRRRDESLFADGIISQGRLSATRAAERQATATLDEKRAALKQAGLTEPGNGAVGAIELRAPFDGVVLDAPAQPGQRVDPATPLFKLGRLAPLWLEIQATPAQAAGLAAGDTVGVAGCAGGKLTLIAPQLDPATQSLLLRAEMGNRDACLKPFQFVQARVEPTRRAGDAAWRVPHGALTRHQDQAWLFVAADGGFMPVAVRVIDETEKSALIAVAGNTPLPGDARVVVKGIAALKAAWLGLGGGEGK